MLKVQAQLQQLHTEEDVRMKAVVGRCMVWMVQVVAMSPELHAAAVCRCRVQLL
jgi:hypothetical protein